MPNPKAGAITLAQAQALCPGLSTKVLVKAIKDNRLRGQRAGKQYLIDIQSFAFFTGLPEARLRELLTGDLQ